MTFPTIDDFYAADERRRRSGELDFGCWWTAGDSRSYHRVSAVKDTGEIYAIRLNRGLRGEPDGEVELLGEGLEAGDYAAAERLMDGWADVCGTPDSLAWVRDRLQAVAA